MLKIRAEVSEDLNQQETQEWIEALDQIIDEAGPDRVRFLLSRLADRAYMMGVNSAVPINTPYLNTIPVEDEVPYPGDRDLERRIKSITRWNAMAMVVRANKYDDGIGGHLSTYASLATLTEVGFNHFFRGSHGEEAGDFVYFQGHASPGVYARAYVEGRLNDEHLKNFRHELREHPGLSSYPHPWLMPDFWNFPTVSMGLGPINSIYQARFMRYLENRSLIPVTNRKIWAFIGDGESDEPESLGSITLATREKLDNLVWVVNCNLQRLDGPVRGNASIIQELEGMFRGAGWNVIKCIWGHDWDALLAKDKSGKLIQRMHECVDGEYQNFKAKGGSYIRQEFFGKYPELLELVADMTDEQLEKLHRGGHDSAKVYNAYKQAMETKGRPTVILAFTIKGYGLGDVAQGRNTSHQTKKLNEEQAEEFRKRFDIPITAEQAADLQFCRPAADSPEFQYMMQRREELGGSMPVRAPKPITIKSPALETFSDLLAESRKPSMTTSAVVAIMRTMLKDPEIGKFVVPIVPDEARTFGMDSMFRQCGIYASQGQLYEPVDSKDLNFYKERKDGQILEEGITEAGSMASFTAAGTAYATYGVPMIPFFIYYSMFGFQRIGDMIWLFADSRGKGFLVGATAGRTTLNGEGLQHQDGHSQVHASTVPNCLTYDPAYAYEVAVIVQDGIRRMYENNESIFYYLTVYNEMYTQPAMPEGSREGILRGIYKYRAAAKGRAVAQLFGSGPILNEALKAQEILAEKYKVATDVWSVTSYNELRRDALSIERWNRLHPAEPVKQPYVVVALNGAEGPIVAATDYMKIVPDQLSPWLGGRLVSLGTDGFGRSENRDVLRQFFEVNTNAIVCATLSKLAREGKFDAKKAQKAYVDLGVDTESADPVTR